MQVKPDELANLCAIYTRLNATRISVHDLKKRVQSILLIDSEVSAQDIIAEAQKYGLVELTPKGFIISNYGRRLGKCQETVAPSISEKAKQFMIKQIYFNPEAEKAYCGDFILRLRVDAVLGTFVYDRSNADSIETLYWLKVLSRVGLLYTTPDRAILEPPYIESVNQLLAKLRDIENNFLPEVSEIRNKVGEVAERCAMEYEKKRLEGLVYPELALLVQQISLVDKYAGYDIISCLGGKVTPHEPIYIEVKGTTKTEHQFIWTRNERRVANKFLDKYWIYSYDQVNISSGTAFGPLKIKDPIYNLNSLGFIGEPIDIFFSQKV